MLASILIVESWIEESQDIPEWLRDEVRSNLREDLDLRNARAVSETEIETSQSKGDISVSRCVNRGL